jgi:hypothetical protein
MQYFIKKGKHNRWTLPKFHLGITYLRFRFKFDDSCVYPIIDTDDYDLNKLYGFSYGMHHKNSLRLGWRPCEKEVGKIQVHTYTYNNGVRDMQYLCTVEVGQWYDTWFEVNAFYKTATFTIAGGVPNKRIAEMQIRFVVPKFNLGYFLDFFMGGDKPARQDTVAWIERVESFKAIEGGK